METNELVEDIVVAVLVETSDVNPSDVVSVIVRVLDVGREIGEEVAALLE